MSILDLLNIIEMVDKFLDKCNLIFNDKSILTFFLSLECELKIKKNKFSKIRELEENVTRDLIYFISTLKRDIDYDELKDKIIEILADNINGSYKKCNKDEIKNGCCYCYSPTEINNKEKKTKKKRRKKR